MPDESAFREMIRHYNEQLFALRPPAPAPEAASEASNARAEPAQTNRCGAPAAGDADASSSALDATAVVLKNPSRYVQGCGVLNNLGRYAAASGGRVFCLVSSSVSGQVEGFLTKSLSDAGGSAVCEHFGGECTAAEVNRVLEQFRASGCELVAGIGGGKLLDTAKAAANAAGVPVITVPTSASAGAACSACALLHTEDGRLEECLSLSASPRLVLADTSIIIAAPARFLAAGMGNALAVWANTRGFSGARTSLAAAQLARSCGETMLEKGHRARLAAERGICTRGAEEVIEACLYLSSIALENRGLSLPHAIVYGLSALPETRSSYYGEKAAFSALVQLLLENAPEGEIEKAVRFCIAAGLPVTLGGLGLPEPRREQLETAARQACAASETLYGAPLPVSAGTICSAIAETDALGESQRKRGC